MSASPLKVAERSAAYSNEAEIEPILGTCFDLLATASGGTAKLRELILSLAFRGNLAARWPSDEGADELLVRIRAQKSHAVAQGLIKAKRQQAQLAEDAIPYGVPGAWRWAPLEHIALRLTDGSHNPPRDSGAGYPMLSSQNVRDGAIDFDNPSRYLSDADFEIENERTQVRSGDVLLTIVASLGRSAVVPEGAPKFALQRSVATVRSPLNPTYLSLFFRSPLSRAYYEKHGKGTAQKGIYLGKLAEMPIPVAPLAEQARIVARVEELMKLCDALEAHGRLQDQQHARLVATLFDALAASESAHALAENWQRIAAHFDLLLDRPEAVDALEQTILQLAVRGLLVPQDPADEPASQLLARICSERERLRLFARQKSGKPLPPVGDGERMFDTPANWCWARMEAICDAIIDCPHSTAKFVESGVLCIDTNSFKSWTLIPHKLRYVTEKTFEERIARLVPQPGDLVFAREGSVGESVLIPDGTRCCLGQRVMLFRFSSLVLNTYVQMVLSSKDFLDRLLALHKGIGAKHVNVGDMRLASIPLPPLAEQHRIVARVEQLRRLCADLRERLRQSRTTQSHLADALVNAAAQYAGTASVDVTR